MGDLSANFDRIEFACQCGCGFDTVDAELVKMLERVREFFDRRITITSGCRCEEHNRKVGGSPRSQHLQGRAADFLVDSTPSPLVHEYCLGLKPGGLGKYDGFTHIDSRSGNQARW